jgi:hypothetical protein
MAHLAESETIEPSSNIRDYKIKFTPKCLDDLERLKTNRDDILDSIQGEFRHHANYFLFDLEDYTMPLRGQFLVHMDKTGTSLVLKGLFLCTENEQELASWSGVLTLYRRATRLAYRTDPNLLYLRKGHYDAVSNIHQELHRQITNHFEKYRALRLQLPGRALETPELIVKNGTGATSDTEARTRVGLEIAFHLSEAMNARRQGLEIAADLDNGLRKPEASLGDLVTCLERSLQHIHKVLLQFPPKRNDSVES